MQNGQSSFHFTIPVIAVCVVYGLTHTNRRTSWWSEWHISVFLVEWILVHCLLAFKSLHFASAWVNKLELEKVRLFLGSFRGICLWGLDSGALFAHLGRASAPLCACYRCSVSRPHTLSCSNAAEPAINCIRSHNTRLNGFQNPPVSRYSLRRW